MPHRRATGTSGIAVAIVRSVLVTRRAEFNLAVLTQRRNDSENSSVFSASSAQQPGSARRMVQASVIQNMLAAEALYPKA